MSAEGNMRLLAEQVVEGWVMWGLTDPMGGFDRLGVGQSSAMFLSQFVPAHGAVYAIFLLFVLNGQICFRDNLA